MPAVGEARTCSTTRTCPTSARPRRRWTPSTASPASTSNQQLLQQTPPPLSTWPAPDIEGARLLIEGVLAERRKVLTEMESKALLAAFHIPGHRTMLARSANEAMLIASQLGYPVALKIDSPDISHKSDVQGVALDVHERHPGARHLQRDAGSGEARPARRAHQRRDHPAHGRPARGREVYIGLTTDDPFGPVITFGAGGTMIELIADRAMELPPLNQFLARRLIERSRVYETLGEWRGAPAADMEALEQLLLRVSEMVCELPQLREMDINPVIVDDTGAVAVDARIVIDNAQAQAPGHTTTTWPSCPTRRARARVADEGRRQYTIRPIHPDDADMLQTFVRSLSPESRYFRFASAMPELPARMLARFTLIDYDREMALVAVHKERQAGEDGERHRDRAHRGRVALHHQPRPAPAASSRWWWPTTSRARAWARG
jgi:acetyltransferase